MTYQVVIVGNNKCFSVSCPGLLGCHSQGETEAEALANIKDAARDYLQVGFEAKGVKPKEATVSFHKIEIV